MGGIDLLLFQFNLFHTFAADNSVQIISYSKHLTSLVEVAGIIIITLSLPSELLI